MSVHGKIDRPPPLRALRTFGYFEWANDSSMSKNALAAEIDILTEVIRKYAESDANLRLLAFNLETPETHETRRFSDG
jgi:hypothetical protein